ncbi:hypothetical protein Maes01_02688 [Microbulbifer aestuariivivens]|uniref:Uncharacterized protein n=1 Tax=Microbulbifer aestuariivivens TaxID=1908308 RepID=A0ABP9WSJ7_9GAMM
MSYDLMVFEPSVAPRQRKAFMEWFAEQTRWAEGHSYRDHAVSSEALQAWFKEMIAYFPPMNGPLASGDVDNERVTDHCVGKSVIYSAFSWSVAEEAFPVMRELAIKHRVGFFDVSAEDGEILFPDEENGKDKARSWWKIW